MDLTVLDVLEMNQNKTKKKKKEKKSDTDIKDKIDCQRGFK